MEVPSSSFQETELASSTTTKQCRVCNAPASGTFFGAVVCIPCKVFRIVYFFIICKALFMKLRNN